MNTSPDQFDDNTPDASELLDFELIAKSQPEKSRGLWLWVVLVLVLVGGGGAGWMYLQTQNEDLDKANAGGVPLIMAPQFSLKEKPVYPGGMKIPDRDKSIYNRMNGTSETAVSNGVEHILPPAETPLNLPKALPKTPPKTVAKVVESIVSTPPPVAVPAPTAAVRPAPAPAVAPSPPVVVSKAVDKVLAKPVASTLGKVASTAPAGLGYMIQLSAVRTEQAAKGEWNRLAKKHPDILNGLETVIQRADLGTRGIFYRVRGGWLATRTEAKAVCAELARRNVGCIIVKP